MEAAAEEALYDDAVVSDDRAPEQRDSGPIVGHCDGFRGSMLLGWAWHPEQPDRTVEIELLIDGEIFATVPARQYRGDLRSAGIGDGRYGWRIPFPWDWSRERRELDLVVRPRGGDPLANGAFVHRHEPPVEDQENAEFQAFVTQVLDPGEAVTVAGPKRGAPPLNILLHSATGGDAASLGLSEYSYGFVAKAYRPVLERLGRVHDVSGTPERADELHAEFMGRGEGCMLFSFHPPHRTSLTLRAPIVPMIAWEYPTVPEGDWGGEPGDDWRHVLRQAGRAVVASAHSAAAVRAALGATFPVAAIPHPIFDRVIDAGPAPDAAAVRKIAIDGYVFDTRDRDPKALDRSAALATGRCVVAFDGVVFTSVFSPRDGRKAWLDTITAFIDAHRDTADATLVLKMISRDPAEWRWELQGALAHERPFACRLIVLHGYLDEPAYATLMTATHWIVSATLAEGQCLPLLEFMSAGRPALTAAHSAMADYVMPENALIVAHSEERCSWPNDPENRMQSSRARLSWESLRAAFRTGRDMVVEDRQRYDAMGRQARETMRGYCSDAIVGERLDSFLGLGAGLAIRPSAPSALFDHSDDAA
jgi:hypothetical protein